LTMEQARPCQRQPYHTQPTVVDSWTPTHGSPRHK
jgi:hypothetical protein